MQKSKKKNVILIILLISLFIVIPNLLIGILRDNKIRYNEKPHHDIYDNLLPEESFVYYEDTIGNAMDVYVSGDYAYVADGLWGLAIIDISDPTNPGIPIYEDTRAAYGVYVSGDYAYIADYDSGLAIINISDPTNPGTPVYEDTTGDAYGVYVSGNYAYVGDRDSGLAIIDISDPTNPGTPIYEDTIGDAYGVYVSGDYAYVANWNHGLAVIDISDPTNPGTPVYEDTTGYAYDVYVSGDYAYLADGTSGLAVIDISDPTNPGTPVYEDTTEWAWGIFVEGNYAYVGDDYSGLAVIDISDPTNPRTPVYEDTIERAYGVYVCGDHAYLGDWLSGLAVIDISEPIDPGTPIYRDTLGAAYGVCVSGDYAYVADSGSGLAVFNISNPTNPRTRIYEDNSGRAEDIYVNGDYAYMADSDSGLAVIDISDPTNPGVPVYEDTTGSSVGVYVSGDYAYVADSGSGLAIIDISDPTNPGMPVYQNTGGWAYDVYVSGDYAYVADGTYGLAVIDISDPTNPGIPFYEDTTGSSIDIYVSGDYAYIADDASGLAIINISDPTNPGTPIYEDTIGPSIGVYVSGDYVYLADGTSGLVVINITDPTNPGMPVYEDTTGYAYGIQISGDYAYMAVGSHGLAVIQVRKRVDMVNPAIIDTPSDLTVESEYMGQVLSWTATDANPDSYTIELQGAGIVVGPIVWTSGNAINYNIPDGFSVGSYLYTVNFMDDYGNFITESVTFTVEDTTNPTIINTPNDLAVEFGYMGESLSWTAIDANPNVYTIELQGTGIVTGPTAWISGNATNYNIPNGLSIGFYIYTVNFTDDYGNFITDNVTLTVEDTTSPTITNAPNDFTVEQGYTGEGLAWMATDVNPGTYTIELQGTGIVVGPTVWTNIDFIDYGIPDGFGVGSYIYTVNITDAYDNSVTDIVTFTVEDTTNPLITISPNNFTVEYGYTGQSISWTATDANPDTYTIELQGIGIVTGPTVWTSGNAINYNILDGFGVGSYIFTVIFLDMSGNFITDSVNFTVEDTINPVIVISPINFIVEMGYTGQSISWTATDANPDTYTIELQGIGIVTGPTVWTSGNAINYNIPDGFSVGSYIFTVIFIDIGGNFITDSVNFTVEDTTNPTLIGAPNDLTVELGYTGEGVAWMATDANPGTYTIELQGTGMVIGPTVWTNIEVIDYGIPNGFSVGSYIYTVNITDLYGNSLIDSVIFTVADTTNPVLISTPSDLTSEFGYTGQSLSWTATDSYPYAYTIELQGLGIVIGPTAWISSIPISYNIPDGFAVGVYVYTVNFTDDFGNFITDSATFTVEDTTNPNIVSPPFDLIVEFGSTGENVSWTASDPYPKTYTIELQGLGIVAGPAVWISNNPIIYNIQNNFAVGIYIFTVNFTDYYGNSNTDNFTFTVVDTTKPIIVNASNDFSVEFGYTGRSISWTASDPYPKNFIIELQGSGIIAGPTAWISSLPITYNIPDGFDVGVYFYTVNFTDDFGNSIVDSVIFTVEDTTNPTIISASIDLAVEFGYTGQSISWTASDPHPNTYTIELQGSGIISGPTAWATGLKITNNIPDGFAIGVYFYTINFTDDYGNSIIVNVIFTVGDTTNPTLVSAPIDIVVEFGYTGQSLSWTATDLNSNTYIIELLGSGIVTGLTAWASGLSITYNIPDGFTVGNYVFTVNFTDDSGNSITDSVSFTVEDTIKPIITFSPNNFTVEYGYTGQILSWTVIDLNPNSYSIELQWMGIVVSPTVWVNGITINYNIPDGFGVGSYIYMVNFTDFAGNFIIDNITFTVEDTTNPVISIMPNNFTVEYGYTGQSLSWTATDANPDTYTIELIGIGIAVVSTPWANNTPSVYNISVGFPPGIYTYCITFTDQSGNSISDTVTVTIVEVDETPKGEIPFGNYFLIFMGLSVITLIITKKRKIVGKSSE